MHSLRRLSMHDATVACAARMHVPQAWPLSWENMHGTHQHRQKPLPTTRTGGTGLDLSLLVNSGDPRGIRRGSEGIRGPNRGSGLFTPYVSWGIHRPQSLLI